MSSDREVVLDRAGIVKLAGGMVFLLVLGFMGGAVVGYAMGGVPAVTPPGTASATVRKASATEPCTPTQAAPALKTAGAAAFEPLTPPAAKAVPDDSATPPVPAVSAATDRMAQADPSAPETSAPAATPDDTTPAVDPSTRYAVQLGVFGVSRNAERLASRMRARGYDPIITAMRNRSGQWLKRVNLSVFKTQDEATAAAQTFRIREGLPAVVVAFQEEQK